MKFIGRRSRGQVVTAGALLAILGLVGLVPWRVTAQASPAKLPWPGFYSTTGRQGERVGRDLFLLNRRAALNDLGLTQQQQTQVSAVMADLRRKAHDLGSIWRLPAPQRDIALETNRQILQEAHRQVAAILTASQLQRLRQIDLQQNGAFSLRDEDVARELKLTPVQSQKIARIYQEHMRRLKPIEAPLLEIVRIERRSPPRSVTAKFVHQFSRLHRNSQARMLAVLTGGQRHRFLQMLGRPYASLGKTFLLRQRNG